MRLSHRFVKNVMMNMPMPDKKLSPRNEKSRTKQKAITKGSLNIIGA